MRRLALPPWRMGARPSVARMRMGGNLAYCFAYNCRSVADAQIVARFDIRRGRRWPQTRRRAGSPTAAGDRKTCHSNAMDNDESNGRVGVSCIASRSRCSILATHMQAPSMHSRIERRQCSQSWLRVATLALFASVACAPGVSVWALRAARVVDAKACSVPEWSRPRRVLSLFVICIMAQ